MTLKQKLIAGLGSLFMVITLLGLLGMYYLYRIREDARLILKDNYKTLEFVQQMTQVLDMTPFSPKAVHEFETWLKLQEQNVTEIGERELTLDLRRQFETLKSGRDNPLDLFIAIRENLHRITTLNMEAIIRKNEQAMQRAADAILYLALIGVACVTGSFVFVIYFPAYITRPLKALRKGIQEVADKNYASRINLHAKDEFGELASSFNRMAERLDEYEHSNLAKILFEKKRIESVINRINEAIIGLDEHRQIIFVNAEAVRLLGLDESQLLGRYAPDVAATNDLMRHLIRELMKGQVPYAQDEQDEPLNIFADGRESYFLKEIADVSLQYTGQHDHALIGYVIILKNITPFKELDRAKTNFMATISHELKTPLSSIKMSLRLLSDDRIGQLNQEQHQLIGHIREDSERLLRITGELLDMTQVESGAIQLHMKVTDPRALVEAAVDAMRFTALQRAVSILTTYPEQPLHVQADPDKTTWVLINFLSNAIKYSPEQGQIHVRVTVDMQEERPFIVFTVQDFGTGIEERHQHRIFDRYYQVPGSAKGGTGLGLAISREFVEAQGGRIWFESHWGEGSTFGFALMAATT